MDAVWISVCDGRVLVTKKRLELLYKGLPALRYILEGHPRMKKKQKRAQADGEVKTLIVDDELGVCAEDLDLLIRFFSPSRILPTTRDAWERLLDVGNTFGSSDEIDNLCAVALCTPMTPAMDLANDYSWITVQPEFSSPQTVHTIDQKVLYDGYELVTTFPYFSSAESFSLLVYRKKKTGQDEAGDTRKAKRGIQ